jgi:uncharacterized protein
VIRKVVAYCGKLKTAGTKRFRFELITNGTLLTKTVVDYLIEQKFLLFISIDGWREMHNYGRPSLSDQDRYDTIVANAQYADRQYRNHGLAPPKVRANLTPKYRDILAVGLYLESLGFTTIGVGPIEPLPHGDPSPLALTENEADELDEQFHSIQVDCLQRLARGEKLGPYRRALLLKTVHHLERRSLMGITCGVCRNTATVDVRGNIFPCHRYEGMEPFIIGSVSTGLDRSLVMRYYNRLNTRTISHCRDCWIQELCVGGCPWVLSTRAGEIVDPTSRQCERRRRAVERSLWLRAKLRAHYPQVVKGPGERSMEHWSWYLGGSEAQTARTPGVSADNVVAAAD